MHMKKRNNFIIIDGPMGAGKSTVAALLHHKLKRTAMVGNDRIKWFVSDYNRSKKDTDVTRKVLLAMCEEYLRNGVSILMPQGFLHSKALKLFTGLAKKMHCDLHLYRLQAPRHLLLKRILERGKAAEARTHIPKTRILRNLRLHAKHEYEGATLIDTSTMTPQQVANLIIKDLK